MEERFVKEDTIYILLILDGGDFMMEVGASVLAKRIARKTRRH